jgi:hypothetical protein
MEPELKAKAGGSKPEIQKNFHPPKPHSEANPKRPFQALQNGKRKDKKILIKSQKMRYSVLA